MLILVTNQSTQVTEDQAQKIALAMEIWLCTMVAPSWDRLPPTVRYAPASEPDPEPTEDVARIFIVDDPPAGQDEALGWHSQGPNGAIYSYIFAGLVLKNGGGVLDAGGSSVTTGACVSAVVGHEGGELHVDPNVNDWVDGPARKEGSCYAKEICDPLEMRLVPITLPDGTVVMMPGFVTRAWFDLLAPAALARSVPEIGLKSFEIDPDGGYCEVRQQPGSEQPVYGMKPPPAWKMAMKAQNPGGRTKKRRDKGAAAARV